MSVDYNRLFQEGRLHPVLHRTAIKAKLAAMEVEDPDGFVQFSNLYEEKGFVFDEKPVKKPVEKKPAGKKSVKKSSKKS